MITFEDVTDRAGVAGDGHWGSGVAVADFDADGRPETVRFEETRVWQRIGGRWQHVHFHRSAND